jgi:hypothetical protein
MIEECLIGSRVRLRFVSLLSREHVFVVPRVWEMISGAALRNSEKASVNSMKIRLLARVIITHISVDSHSVPKIQHHVYARAIGSAFNKSSSRTDRRVRSLVDARTSPRERGRDNVQLSMREINLIMESESLARIIGPRGNRILAYTHACACGSYRSGPFYGGYYSDRISLGGICGCR